MSGQFSYLFSLLKWHILIRIMALLKIVAYINRSRHHFSKGPLKPPDLSFMEALQYPSPKPPKNQKQFKT